MSHEMALNSGDFLLLPRFLDKGPSANHHPPDYRKEITLLDGSKATIRPIVCEDKAALLNFHSRLSEETRFLRYHYSKGELTDSDLKTFCDIDYSDVLALVAEADRKGHKEIIGVGRYSRIPPDHTAEVAFVVQDNEQRKGVGTQLLKHLAVLAQQRDIRCFVGEVLRQNGRMLSIFRKSDPKMGQEIDSPCTCNVILSVAEIIEGKSTTPAAKPCPSEH
jgi:GNAT superfamily N-acetyltransferase